MTDPARIGLITPPGWFDYTADELRCLGDGRLAVMNTQMRFDAGFGYSLGEVRKATGEVIARIEPADDAVLDRAVGIAAAAQKEWALRSGHDRAQVLARAARLLRERIAGRARATARARRRAP